MTATAFVWIISILLMSAIQVALCASFVRRFRDYKTPSVDDAQLPTAVVVLCLRGADPFLRDCLDRLAAQDYPRFQICIVLDSHSDPAHRVVRKWLAETNVDNIWMTYVDPQDVSDRASLKTSALRHAFVHLESDVEVVALVDADTLTHPQWLRQMTVPLVNDGVGVVSGNRWYSPQACHLGSLIRFVYNAFSIVPMEHMTAIWPGSLSVRRDIVADPEFLARMRNTSCEDAAILDSMRRAGLRLVYSHDCILLNQEETGLRDCFRFVQRQLLWTRLYNANWNTTLAGTILVYANLVFGLLLVLVSIVTGQSLAAAGIMLAFAGLLVLNFCLLEWMHRVVSDRIERTQNRATTRMSCGIRLRLFSVVALALPFYTLAAITASLVRRVRWRGITYVVEPPGGIRMMGYTPYDEESASGNSVHSL